MKKAVITTNPLTRFLVLAALGYVFLYLLYQFVIKPYTLLDQQLIAHIIKVSNQILTGMGYKTFMFLQDHDMQVFGIDGSNGVWVGANCNAATLFGLFAVFVMAYPGPLKHKLWYIPIGVLVIHAVNIIRVVCLAIIAFYNPYALDFNHNYTFTIIVYAFIFLLWMVWVNKFTSSKTNRHEG